MKEQQQHLLRYLKFNKVLNCVKELDELVKEKDLTKRAQLVKKLEDCVINAISEIAKNCLSGNIPLSKEDFDKLTKYHNILRKISQKSPVKKRKKLVLQSGGFIDTLIPSALCFITSVIKTLLK